MSYVKMVINRDYRHSSTLGYAVSMAKGETTLVPRALVKELLAVGAELVDPEEKKDVLKPVEKPKALYLEGDELEEKLFEIIDALADRNKRGDFTAAGTPAHKAIADYGNLDPKCFDGPMVIEAWEKVKQARGIA